MTRILGLNDYLDSGVQSLQKPLGRTNELPSTRTYRTQSPMRPILSSQGSGWSANDHELNWITGSGWGTDQEFEQQLWLEQTFFNDADTGVTFRESPWDGQWRINEWWR